MGGQACVSYGAAEFSRDVDVIILLDPDNLTHLRAALDELGAELVAVPSFELAFLRRGHAVHFRCREAGGVRLDVMGVLRGVAPFEELWLRRTTLEADGQDDSVDVLGLPDLVLAKKTQREKDWPMIRRLVEASYFGSRDAPTSAQVDFWLAELRTPTLLIEVTRRFPAEAARSIRPAVGVAARGDEAGVSVALQEEQGLIQAEDRAYWTPLKAELERLRRESR